MQLDGAFINLNRSEDRRRSMEHQLRELNCENWVRRFPAINGQTAGPSDNAAENGVWACRRSHIEVVESSDDHSALLVLEDDVELSRYFPTFVNQPTLAYFSEIYSECDILFLDCVSFSQQAPFLLALSDAQMKKRARGKVSEPERHQMANVSILDARGTYAYCSASYVVTPKGKPTLRRLYAEEPESTLPIDIQFRDWIASGQLIANLTVPFLATPQFKNDSTIPYEQLRYAHLDQKAGLLSNAIRRLLFAGDHGLDLTEIEALIAEVARSPEYDLGMRLYQTLRASE